MERSRIFFRGRRLARRGDSGGGPVAAPVRTGGNLHGDLSSSVGAKKLNGVGAVLPLLVGVDGLAHRPLVWELVGTVPMGAEV